MSTAFPMLNKNGQFTRTTRARYHNKTFIMSTLTKAIEIATQSHEGQFDKAGNDYIGHPLRVMEMGRTEAEKIVGVLHDVVEDTDWTFEMLEAEGFSKEVIDALRCVTKLSEKENYDDFIERVKKNRLLSL